jgi:sugar (pentulose or hexulose) kinase
MKYIIGIDIGTQSIRTQLYDEAMNCVCARSRPQFIDTPRPSWITQKASSWWAAVVQNIRDILAESKVSPDDILSIGCCAHMHGPVPVTAGREIVMDDIQLYSDKRAAHIADKLRSDDNFRQIYGLTANPPTSNWFGIKIKWLQQNVPEVYDKADHFVTPKDFINFMLTGNACIDPSEAAGSYLMDRHTNAWSDLLIRNLGVDREKLPEIKKSSQTVGSVCGEAAAATGLSQKTAVVCGGGDMLCSLYTSGLNHQGNVADVTGTGGIICYYTAEPIMDTRIMNLRHVIPGWVPFGNIDSAGGAFRWLRDTIAKEEVKRAREKGVDDYEYLCGLARETGPGADGLLFLPYMAGERTMGSPNSRGCYVGLNMGSTVGHMVRALLEGVALEFKRTLDVFESAGARIERVFHTQGGAKGTLWNQIKADIYGKPV